MQAQQKTSGNPFGSSRISFFGYDTFGAARNMAVDEILKERADREDRFFIRFYDVARPSVILGPEDHYDVIKPGAPGRCDVSRRITGGRPIFLDENTLQYSIAGPLHGAVDPFPREIHKRFGSILAGSIAELIGGSHEISMPRSSSIRIDGKPIAGHGQSISMHRSFLYNGVIVVGPWNLAMISSLLHVSSEDFEELKLLPSLMGMARDAGQPHVQKGRLVSSMMGKLPAGQLDQLSAPEREAMIMEADALSGERYANPKWIFRNDIRLRRDVRFCILYEGEPSPGDGAMPAPLPV